ncbi:2Fe-2S iron-sulfur cluster-binding protein [Natronorubrum daqingense]|uniref:Ferredoxin n=1 Tax=Natronorubrum daqingense TaxID=588898 RepID=A0A1N7DVR3_9EURY|nr:2Fe-2S iron-sulfur cluster-binding protein [Natronorubrum daqingense]APX96206.1 hypothetical protein BB347_05970 [Natronorubrum daqingense]SIR79932.1 Ferredoxin [Natronorubrum daqingense]
MSDDGCSGEDGPCENRIELPKNLSVVQRRRLLAAVGSGSSVALAGCVGLFEFGDQPAQRQDDDEEENGDEDEDNGDTEDEDEDEGPFEIAYLLEDDDGGTIEVPEDENLLEAGEAEDWELPYQCREGFCGQCMSRIDGDGSELVEMTNNDVDELDDDAIEDGYVLTCTGEPRGAFELEVGAHVDDEDEGASYEIEYLLEDGESQTVEVPEDENLLEAGEDEGLELPYQCRSGNCGQCTSRVDGDGSELVEMTENNVDELDDETVEDGYILTCTGKPRDEFELSVGDQPDA